MTKEYLNLEEKKCPVCGAGLVSIGEEFVRRELVFIPAQLKVVKYYSISYSCPECKRKDFPTIKKRKRWKSPYAVWNEEVKAEIKRRAANLKK